MKEKLTLAGEVAIGTLIRGFTFYQLWNWFIVDIFNLKPMTLAQAVGFVLLIYYMHYQQDPDKDKGTTPQQFIIVIFNNISKSMIYLIEGGVIYYLFVA